jgi:predicted MPP superfamily phosphohydrolase
VAANPGDRNVNDEGVHQASGFRHSSFSDGDRSMWLLVGFLAPLTLLGHFALCVAVYNRVHATGWPRWAVRVVSMSAVIAAVVVPLGLGFWCVSAAQVLAGAGGMARGVSPLAYLAVCLVASIYVIGAWVRRQRVDPHADALVSNHTSVVKLPRELAGDFVTAALARIPGNQILELNVHEKTVALPRLSPLLDGLAIAHLSDLHFTGQLKKEFFQEVVDRANALEVDLAVLTGDLIDDAACIDWIPDTLGRLRARYGVFFVLGNHDLRVRNVPRLRATLADAGITDLGGRWTMLDVRGHPVFMAGNELPWFTHASDATGCPADRDGKAALRIALSHTPDQIAWARACGFDLMLAGHTHGGQICLPLVGPIISPSRRGVRNIAGAYLEGTTLLHISRGVSGTKPVRINCPPELTKLILRPSRRHKRVDCE